MLSLTRRQGRFPHNSWDAAWARSRARHAPAPGLYPRFARMSPPLIVIGMHRSGTSVVAQMLDRLGVYMGPQLGLPGVERHASAQPEVLAEAPQFLALNERLLGRAGATWDAVDPFLKR